MHREVLDRSYVVSIKDKQQWWTTGQNDLHLRITQGDQPALGDMIHWRMPLSIPLKGKQPDPCQ